MLHHAFQRHQASQQAASINDNTVQLPIAIVIADVAQNIY